MATVIGFINQKGGCGKSSTCFHLAGYFAQLGMNTLVIDADPQGSLSQGFLGSAKVESLADRVTLTARFSDRAHAAARKLVVPSAFAGVSLICANHTLAEFNIPAPHRSGMKQFALAELVDELTAFDLVLIDCPPNLYQCTWNALLAADFVVIPVPPEDFGTQGLRAVHQAIDSARQLNAPLTLLGHLITRRDNRLVLHRAYERKLRNLYPHQVFTTVVPEAAAFKLALACRTPVTWHAPASRAAKLTKSLGCEMVRRMEESRLLKSTARRSLSHG